MLPYQNLSLDDMPGEVWKDIHGWEGYYQVSSIGRIKSLCRASANGKKLKTRILRQTFRMKGYLAARLYYGGDSKSYQVARLVTLAFLPNPEEKPTVDHINNIKTDNRVENLRWATYHENMMNPISLSRRRETFRIKYPKKQKGPDRRTVPIVAVNIESHEVRRYSSIKESSKDGFNPKQVSSVCCKFRNSLYGWKFFRTDDPELKAYLTNLQELQER